MNGFVKRQAQVWLMATCALLMAGCGLGEGIHVARDPGKSTSRFRYEFEMIPNAVVMREDTEPRWQLGRYVFVRGADRVLVISRITSWSDTATREQRKSGDIPDMKDQILERLWITIPQGTAIGEELDLHALGYRFMVNYDRGLVGDEQFARPFRALGNVRVLQDNTDSVKVRLRLRLTTDMTTAWEVLEGELTVPVISDGRYAKMAQPDAVIYSISRPGELPSVGMTPVQITPEMTGQSAPPAPMPTTPATRPADQAKPDAAATSPVPAADQPGKATLPAAAPDAVTPAATTAPAATTQSSTPSTEPADTDAAAVDPGQISGRWYSRTPAWEVFLQLNEDGTFNHSASRPNVVPVVVTGDWRLRSGYVVLHLKTYLMGKTDQMELRKDNPYCMLKLHWVDANTVAMDGDMPASGPVVGGYVMHRASFPDLNFIPAPIYEPGSPRPPLVGQETPEPPASNDAPAKTGTPDAPAKTGTPDASAKPDAPSKTDVGNGSFILP